MLTCRDCKKRRAVIINGDGKNRCPRCGALYYLKMSWTEYDDSGKPPPKGKVRVEEFLKNTFGWLEGVIKKMPGRDT